jgi:hypothetical protein
MYISSLSRLPDNSPLCDRVFCAIQDLEQKHVVSVVDEAKKYCYKLFSGEIKVVDKAFIIDLSGGFCNG